MGISKEEQEKMAKLMSKTDLEVYQVMHELRIAAAVNTIMDILVEKGLVGSRKEFNKRVQKYVLDQLEINKKLKGKLKHLDASYIG